MKELLFNIGEAPEWQRTGSSDEHVTRGSECNSGYTAEGDRNNAQREAGGGDQEREAVRPGQYGRLNRCGHI